MWEIRIAALAMVVGLGRLASAEPVDLSKPFEADKDTICLFHLDDVAGGEVKDSVAGGKSGKVKEPMTADSVTASFGIDGAWRNVTGSRSVPVGRWTHLAITYDQGKKEVGIFLNGLLDEVRVSSVVREYRPLPGSEKDEDAASSGPPAAGPKRAASSAEAGPSKFVFPWAVNTGPTDTPKSHVQEITQGTQKYEVVQGGTMDGWSCRTPMGVGMNSEGAFFQTWESNRSVRMENVGDTDVLNPWLSNGRNHFRNVAEIVQSAITPDMTDAEKAFAIWFQQIRYRHHSGGE